MVPPIFAAAGAATSHPRDVRHTAPLLTAERRAPTPFGLLLRSVIPPTRTARLSPARALLEPSFGVLLSLMAFICPHCSRISPACQEFCPGSRLSYGKRRKIDRTAAPRTTVRPFFLSTRLSPPPIVLPHPIFSPPAFSCSATRFCSPPPVEPPPVETTTRRTAGAVFTGATKHPALSRRVRFSFLCVDRKPTDHSSVSVVLGSRK